MYVLSGPTNVVEERSESDTQSELEPAVATGVEVVVKFRLSSTALNKDIKMTVRSTDSVLKVKKMLEAQEGVEVAKQRWFFSGRLLQDKIRIEDAKIPKGFVVQVIVNPEDPPPVTS